MRWMTVVLMAGLLMTLPASAQRMGNRGGGGQAMTCNKGAGPKGSGVCDGTGPKGQCQGKGQGQRGQRSCGRR